MDGLDTIGHNIRSLAQTPENGHSDPTSDSHNSLPENNNRVNIKQEDTQVRVKREDIHNPRKSGSKKGYRKALNEFM